jgi:hypothetical protein
MELGGVGRGDLQAVEQKSRALGVDLVGGESHQQVMGLPEHQIRLSKGLTAKFVLPLGLWAAKSRLAWKGGRLGCCPWN